jgi:hypothetical protein
VVHFTGYSAFDCRAMRTDNNNMVIMPSPEWSFLENKVSDHKYEF